MVFVKVQKNKAYFKRYQVKLRRRREGKTDYYARRKLVFQSKNKYNAPKRRFVVRITNRKIICQIVYSTIQGDRVLCAADSTELRRYGIPSGHTNYAAAYATGLLLVRRLLKQLRLDGQFEGVPLASGEEFHVEETDKGRRPFKCMLDVGIVTTTTGNRVFGALKGACDGGLDIPHTNKRFPGFVKDEDSSGSYDAEVHRARIFGLHVSQYMQQMKDESPEKYETHFSQFIHNNISPDGIESMYKNAHAKIRANPGRIEKSTRSFPPVSMRQGVTIKTSTGSYIRRKKISSQERRERVTEKIRIVREKIVSEAVA